MKKIIFSILILALLISFRSRGFAQTSNPVIITWQANNFYPADYQGRVLPSFDTPIAVAAEVVQNNKLTDLSQANFLWYVDENLISRGVGLKETTFNAKKSAGDYHFIRVVIQTPDGGSFTNSTRIYVQTPMIIITGDFPNQAILVNDQTVLNAVPYFFNVTSLNDLNFSWLVNGQQQNSGSDNQLLLTINGPKAASGGSLQLMAAAQNIKNPFESANNQLLLTTY